MTKEQEERFFKKFGADKIWVDPSRENVETILDIWSFIHEVAKETTSKLKEEILAEIDKLPHALFDRKDLLIAINLATARTLLFGSKGNKENTKE